VIPDWRLAAIFAGEVEAIGLDLAQQLRENRIQAEDAFTSRLIDRIAQRFNRRRLAGIEWNAIETIAQGPDAQERATGADLLGVLQVELPTVRVAKGFLAQAKLVSQGRLGELDRQCEAMLDFTPASYVWLYAEAGVYTAPALGVAAGASVSDLHVKTLGDFFADHFKCWIGDRRFAAANRAELEALRADYRARRALLVTAAATEEVA
jgi:hypothetical protein